MDNNHRTQEMGLHLAVELLDVRVGYKDKGDNREIVFLNHGRK